MVMDACRLGIAELINCYLRNVDQLSLNLTRCMQYTVPRYNFVTQYLLLVAYFTAFYSLERLRVLEHLNNYLVPSPP